MDQPRTGASSRPRTSRPRLETAEGRLRASARRSPASIEVLVAHGRALLREGVSALFAPCDDLHVVALAATAEEAVTRARATEPQVAILDVCLPDRSGILACKDIRSHCPDTAVLMLSATEREEWVFAAIEAGATGCLLEYIDGTGLAEAVRLAAAGQSMLDPMIVSQVLARLRSPTPGRPPIDERLARLTPVERRILKFVAEGLANNDIAKELGYALPTVKKYVSSILSKLRVARRTEAAAYLHRHAPRHVEF